MKLNPGAKNVGFIVVGKDGVKDVDADRFLDPSVTPEVWLKQGDTQVSETRPGTPEPPDENTAIIHYRRADGDYAGWGLHLWGDGIDPAALAQVAWDRPWPAIEAPGRARWRPVSWSLVFSQEDGPCDRCAGGEGARRPT